MGAPTIHTYILSICLLCCGVVPALAQQAHPDKTPEAPKSSEKPEDSTDPNKQPQTTTKPSTPVPRKTAKDLTREEEDALFELDERADIGPDANGRRSLIERAREKDIAMMSEQELLDAGFVFGDKSSDSRVRSTATLLALTAGSAFHGIGHWYMGDRNTGIALAMMEAAGVVIAGVAGIIPMAYGADFGVSPYSRQLMYFGAGLFGASYVLDVIGTAQNSEQLTFTNSNRIRGATASAKYGYLELGGLPIRNVLRGDLALDVGPVYVLGRTVQDVGLQLSTYGGTVGVRVWRSARWPQMSVFLEADSQWLESRSVARFEQLDVVGMLGVSLDLGVFSKHLNQIVWGFKTGYLHQWFAFPDATRADPLTAEQPPAEFSYSLGGIPFEMYVHFNLSARMHARFAYTRRDGDLLQSTDDFLAIPSLQINYRSTEKLDIELKAEYGAGLGLWGGFKYWLWQGESLRRRKPAPSTASVEEDDE